MFTVLSLLRTRHSIHSIGLVEFLRFPTFLGLQSFIFKAVLCILRRLRKKDDGYNSFIAGFLSAFSLLLNDSVELRKILALYTLVRALKILYDIYEEKGYYKSSEYKLLALAFPVSIFFSFLFLCDYDIWPPAKY